MLVQSFVERLRPLVGIKSWDYIILWKLSSDHRCVELMECCCAGGENIKNGGEEQISFQDSSSSSFLPCRDCLFPHPRIKSCDLLDHLPSSMPLDSGVHAQTLLSNQSCWLNYSHNYLESSLSEETIGTRVLIPLSLGLLELFVTKQVSEDQQLIDFITSQFNFFVEEQALICNNNSGTISFSSDHLHPNNNNNNTQTDPLISLFHHHQIASSDFSKDQNILDLPQDISIDRIHLSTSSPLLNPMQQQFINGENGDNVNGIYLDGATPYNNNESTNFTPSIENNGLDSITEMNEDSFRCENNRSDESDPNDDEFDAKYRRRTGKGPQSKNLRAERRRRKKLNDRLYSLRSLVPNISKLDRASILGDAIDYVNELKKQAEELQIELEERSDEEDDAKRAGKDETDQNNVVNNQNGRDKRGPKRGQGNCPNGFHSNNIKVSKQNNHEQDDTNDKVQQMEPQVEVFQLDGNEFFVKVFCEHKSGGFVRLMEALNSLGLEVTNVNTTRHTCLVSSIFKVEQKNNDNVEADHVKESLLELTRNPSRIMWPPINNNNAPPNDHHHQISEEGIKNFDTDYCVLHDNAHHHHHHHSLLHGGGRQMTNSHHHHLQH